MFELRGDGHQVILGDLLVTVRNSDLGAVVWYRAGTGNPRGVRCNFEALEQRRLEAARVLRKGLSQAEVPRQVGVHRQSVSRLAKQLAEGGKPSEAGGTGRP